MSEKQQTIAAFESQNSVESEKSGLISLQLRNFRNIRELELFPHPQFNFFYGDNAQGKTSILEAIYFLSELKSFRVSDLKPLIFHQEELAHISATLQFFSLHHELKVTISPFEKRVILNEKVPKPYRRLRKLLPIILFTPDSTRLFRSSPSSRREYFDHFFSVLSESFSVDVSNYNKVLRQKLRLIEETKKNGRVLSLEQLEIWNERLAEIGSRIIYQRFEFTKKLSVHLALFFQQIAESNWKTEFYYQPYLSEIEPDLSIEKIGDLLRKEMEKRFGDEINRCQVLVGPHRDDWSFLLHHQNLKEEGSQGQHRLAITALKLAEAETMRTIDLYPIALFDDLLSELDETRIFTVLKTLEKNKTQLFLTSTTPPQNSLKQLTGKSFKLLEGKVTMGELIK